VRTIGPVLACGILAAGLCGCQSARSYHFDRDTVWRAAIGEAVVWRPNVIDDEKYIIESRKIDPIAGTELHYQLKVVPDINPFAPRPSTRIYVRMEQLEPKSIRFKRLEEEFLMRVNFKLEALSQPASP